MYFSPFCGQRVWLIVCVCTSSSLYPRKQPCWNNGIDGAYICSLSWTVSKPHSWGGWGLLLGGPCTPLGPQVCPWVCVSQLLELASAHCLCQSVLSCSPPPPQCLPECLALVQSSEGFQSSTVIFQKLTAWDPNPCLGLFARSLPRLFCILTYVSNNWSCTLSFKRILYLKLAIWMV